MASYALERQLRILRRQQMAISETPTSPDTRNTIDADRRRSSVNTLAPRNNQDRITRRSNHINETIRNANRFNNACVRKRLEPAWTHEERCFLASLMNRRPRLSPLHMSDLFNERFTGKAVPREFHESGRHPGRPWGSMHVEFLLYRSFYKGGVAPPQAWFLRDPKVIKSEELDKLKRMFADPSIDTGYEAWYTPAGTMVRTGQTREVLTPRQRHLLERARQAVLSNRGLRRNSLGGLMDDEKPAEGNTDALTQQLFNTAEAMSGLQIDEKENQDQDMEGTDS